MSIKPAAAHTGAIAAALDSLHGARKLPAAEAVEHLDSSLDVILPMAHENKIAGDACAALNVLATDLEESGSATDDAWQHAIETMTSLPNKPRCSLR